jgi:hypothetical protein
MMAHWNNRKHGGLCMLTLAGSSMLILAGCPFGGKHVSVSEPSFEQQVQAVQAGRSHEIRSSALIGEIEFRQLHGLEELEVLSLQNARLSDEIAETLSTLHGLRQLRLEKAPVADQSAEAIGTLSKLTTINLPASMVSDQGISDWPGLPELILLRIGSPRLTDAALQTIGRMRPLRFLHLINVPVSDAGLPFLYPMNQLESFYLDGGMATDRGLSELIQALPELHFHRDQEDLLEDPSTDNHEHPQASWYTRRLLGPAFVFPLHDY